MGGLAFLIGASALHKGNSKMRFYLCVRVCVCVCVLGDVAAVRATSTTASPLVLAERLQAMMSVRIRDCLIRM